MQIDLRQPVAVMNAEGEGRLRVIRLIFVWQTANAEAHFAMMNRDEIRHGKWHLLLQGSQGGRQFVAEVLPAVAQPSGFAGLCPHLFRVERRIRPPQPHLESVMSLPRVVPAGGFAEMIAPVGG